MNSANTFSKAIKFLFVGLIVALVAILALRDTSSLPIIEPPNDPWFQSEVVSEARPVLVKFGAEWCGPCKYLDDSINHVAKELSSDVKFIRIDVDENSKLADHYRIRSIPRTFIFHHGKIVADKTGALDVDGLKKWIQSSLAKILKA